VKACGTYWTRELSVLNIEHLSVQYYRRGLIIPAVRDFSLTINPGETVGLVGESGSGKSTVALAILRLIRPQEGRITAGKILFRSDDLLSLPDDRLRAIRGKRISMIFQDPFTSLNPVMRIREQMEEVLTAHSEFSAQSSEISKSLERVQLDPVRILNAYPHQLSGGQRQRVLIAMALLGSPELILADEPTTALDMLVQKDILDLLFDLQKQLHFGMLFISHNLALVVRYTQRLAIMKGGVVAESGTTLDILHHPAHPYTKELWAAIPRL
jgi:ABC-type dipeptide/oligopeptide/nickel transport system ATPase component